VQDPVGSVLKHPSLSGAGFLPQVRFIFESHLILRRCGVRGKLRFHPFRLAAACLVLPLTGCAGVVMRSPARGAFQLSISASKLDFGSVALNTVSTRTLTLTSMGTGAVTVNAITLVGKGFVVSGAATFPATLNPGESLTLQLSFNPTAPGSASATMTIASNSSGDNTATIGLSGTGTNLTHPVLALSTTTLNFGDAPAGVPVTLPVTLTSTGTSPVTVSGATLSGTGFTFAGATFPVTLNPTIAISIQVQFDPGAVGAASGTLTFTSDSATGTASVVNLSGNGAAVQHYVNLTWSAPVKSPVPISGYHIYRAIGGGGSYQLLNSSAASKTFYVDVAVISKTTYAYYVTSIDASGTESVPSNQVTATIP
jgi:Abnormal spindle-like microcephaly-assoc'd, ASPM-SPD-2-Hydin